MGPLQLAVTWYKIHHAGEQAVHWDIQNKATSIHQAKVAFSLFWMSQCVACSPAWWILYRVTASCKGPIFIMRFKSSEKWPIDELFLCFHILDYTPKIATLSLSRVIIFIPGDLFETKFFPL